MTLGQPLLFLIFGPGLLVVALVLSLTGIFTERAGLVFLGGILAGPPALVLGGMPGYWPAVSLPFLHFAAGVLAGQGRRAFALILTAPSVAAFAILGWQALR